MDEIKCLRLLVSGKGLINIESVSRAMQPPYTAANKSNKC